MTETTTITSSRVVYNLDIQPCTENDETKSITHHPSYRYRKVDVADGNSFTKTLRHIWKNELSQLQQQDQHQQHLHVCLVNNAGIFETTENHNVVWDETTSISQIDTILQTNLGSVIHGTRTLVQLITKQHNSGESVATGTTPITTTIINMASTAALGPFPAHPVYAATKAAILSFTQTAQIDHQHDPLVHIYAVCPGIIDTPMGWMGGTANTAAVAQLKGGVRTSPHLVAKAVLGLFHQEYPNCSYLVVDNHDIENITRG
jgi:NAD(P)-dependent dehydrogenase (short-subunit alcohol dehydrogenase family)